MEAIVTLSLLRAYLGVLSGSVRSLSGGKVCLPSSVWRERGADASSLQTQSSRGAVH